MSYGASAVKSNDLHSVCARGDVGGLKLLLEDPELDLNAKDAYLSTPLHLAAKRGHLDCVRLLIEKGAEVDSRDLNGATPLCRATEGGHLGCMEFLIEQDAVVDSENKHGATPLYRATEDGHLDCVELLIEKGALVDSEDEYKLRLLVAAIRCPSIRCFRVLFENCSGGGVKNGSFMTQLLSQVIADRQIAFLDYLFAKGVVGKDTPGLLERAVKSRGLDVVDYLIQKGIDVTTLDKNGKQPVHYAAELGYDDILKRLLDAGADKDVGEYEENVRGSDSDSDSKSVRSTLSFDSEPEIEIGTTPLHYAAANGRESCVRALIKAGAELNAEAGYSLSEQETPLQRAIENKYFRCAALLIRAGAKCNGTLLHQAIIGKDIGCVRLLIEVGVGVNVKDGYGKTPLYYAARQGNPGFLRLLILGGAEITDEVKGLLQSLTNLELPYDGHVQCAAVLKELQSVASGAVSVAMAESAAVSAAASAGESFERRRGSLRQREVDSGDASSRPTQRQRVEMAVAMLAAVNTAGAEESKDFG